MIFWTQEEIKQFDIITDWFWNKIKGVMNWLN